MKNKKFNMFFINKKHVTKRNYKETYLRIEW